MEEEKLFRDDLTLGGLAGHLEITEKDLSELLNSHPNKNFYGLVNHYRVQEVCRILLEHPGQTILSIGYEVGFRNLSTFNSAFSKQMGINPGMYRKTAGKKGDASAPAI